MHGDRFADVSVKPVSTLTDQLFKFPVLLIGFAFDDKVLIADIAVVAHDRIGVFPSVMAVHFFTFPE